jgi:hypothetical protein
MGSTQANQMWHCLTHHVRYDEATHVANRNRALGLAAWTRGDDPLKPGSRRRKD